MIYKDAKDVLCRRWNWRDAEKTKVTEKTKNAIFYIDALPPVNKTKLKEILRDIVEMLEMFCSPEATSIYFLDEKNNSVSL